MSIDDQHFALPQTYGGPAYARPPVPVATMERPFDPDELPIEAYRTEEERKFAAALPARAYAPGGIALGRLLATESGDETGLRPRAFSLRAMAGRLIHRGWTRQVPDRASARPGGPWW